MTPNKRIWQTCDQGCQFTCIEWIKFLNESEIKISMDGKGRALDNIFIERFWRTVKYEYIYLWSFDTPSKLTHGIKGWMNYYNKKSGVAFWLSIWGLLMRTEVLSRKPD